MKCEKCVENASCDDCFVLYCKKRVRQAIADSGKVQANETLELIDIGWLTEVASILLKEVIKGLPHTIARVSQPTKKHRSIWPLPIEVLGAQFWQNVFEGEIPQLPEGIHIFSRLKRLELERFASIRDIPITDSKENSVTSQFLDSIESKYPGLKRSVLKSAKFFDKLE